MANGLEIQTYHVRSNQSSSCVARALDCLLIAVVFAAFAASPPPDVNEAHYLTKARQFWQPDWLPHDLFVASSFAHWVFYATLGWLTIAMDFDSAAWVGRVIGWLLLAIGWEALATALILPRIGKIVSAVSFVALVQVCNLSGEWIVGGIESKVPAYALVLFALSRAARNDWCWVWPILGLASGFHVLVGGWSFLSCLLVRVVRCKQEPIIGNEIGAIAVGLIMVVALGIVPSVVADFGVDQMTRSLAATVYVRERISHHLYFWDFSRGSLLGFGLLVVIWRELARGDGGSPPIGVLHAFAAASLVWTAGGIALSFLASWTWSQAVSEFLLRFYWFRMADVALPIAVAMGATSLLRLRSAVGVGLSIAALVVCIITVSDRWRDGRPPADRQSLPSYPDNIVRTRETHKNWVRVCQWIATQTPSDAIFLTPRQQQSFTWYSGRSEFVNWKNIPQDARSIVVWRDRMTVAYGPSWTELQLPFIPREEWGMWLRSLGVDYVVMEQGLWIDLIAAGPTAPLKLVFPADSSEQTTYVVLKVDQLAD